MNAAENTTGIIHEATVADIDLLVTHHVAMFKEIAAVQALNYDDEAYHLMAVTYAEKLREQLPDGTCTAWIVFSGTNHDIPSASAGVTVVNGVPTPFDPSSYRAALLHSVYTESQWRRQGLAGMLVKRAVEFTEQCGINRIDLAASDAGRQLYERMGFTLLPSMMRRCRRQG